MLPPVSCFCITYKRTHLLEEMIESFLRQDYVGKKQLIILNDDVDQVLIFEHPEVRIINHSNRFNTIGEKRNAAVQLCDYDLIMPWDDDDIYLPHKISHAVEKLLFYKVGYYNFNQAFLYSLQEGIQVFYTSFLHANSIYKIDAFNQINGYSAINIGEDADFIDKLFNQNIPVKIEADLINPEVYFQTYYIYRWGGINGHVSGYKPITNLNDTIRIDRKKEDPKMGIIILKPHWKNDYVALAARYLNQYVPE